MRRIIAGLVLVLVLLPAAIGCTASRNYTPGSPGTPKGSSGRSQEAPDRYSRSDSGQAGIWVEVTWASPELIKETGSEDFGTTYEVGNYTVFVISMTTHSGTLLDYDYLKNTLLLVDGREYSPADWQYMNEDSHHPSGVLRFPQTGKDGKSILEGASTTCPLQFPCLRGGSTSAR